ncbi:phenol 2-monooxygenase P4 subunit [Solimonas aquatica]|uniref:Phenol 2-monooxygenase P4 subunit n=1 Tax=Solimonas aquatica TaxID=489703 RepID=A0A1H9BH80_9GAMM|nr:phenol hydroxylase subunit P4 [Solimonas aquatica]SEP88255.1 phenol 2-monooxygenase P4 subunit [Solimonas aquatica]
MSVRALKTYEVAPLDSVDRFHGSQLLYVGWDDHLMFCAPFALCLSPTTLFRDIQTQILPELYGAHPDFKNIDWNKVQWLKSGQPWTPEPDRTVAGNGLKHKDVIRLRTPGLTGIQNSRS